NRTLVEAARTMLSAAKVPLFFWAEAIATACFTQNRSLVIPRHEKTPYHIINARKPLVKFFHIFGSLCYIIRDGENLDKMKEKGDACIFVWYSTQSKAYRPRTTMSTEVHQAAETVTTSNELDLLFGPLFDEYSNGENQVVLKSSVVTTTDASNKRQQQPESTSSTSTLATT
ncbi:retrovirus-related pol polyprotein from transposon TNT 1-94, partial [Tanacetum coccineum]